MSPLQTFLDRIEAAGLRYHQAGSSFMAQCPSHDDDSPSLRVTEGDDGKVLLFCLAGCHAGQIVGEIGLELRDLFMPHEGPLTPIKPKLVPVAGGGWATRAEREVIERETAALIRRWADNFVPQSLRKEAA